MSSNLIPIIVSIFQIFISNMIFGGDDFYKKSCNHIDLNFLEFDEFFFLKKKILQVPHAFYPFSFMRRVWCICWKISSVTVDKLFGIRIWSTPRIATKKIMPKQRKKKNARTQNRRKIKIMTRGRDTKIYIQE